MEDTERATSSQSEDKENEGEKSPNTQKSVGDKLSQHEFSELESISALLSGDLTKGWKAGKQTKEEMDVSPNSLISEHPEALLREGRTVHYFECPDCGFMIEVTTTKRPLEVNCDSCGSRFRLKGKLDEKKDMEIKEDKEKDWSEKEHLAELAMKYHKRGDLNKSIEVYDKILEISDNDPVVWNNKGVALDGLGMHILAVKCYEKAIQLRDTYIDAWFNLAYSQYKMKQFETALESLRTLLRLKPDHKEGNYLLDKCEEGLKAWKSYLD